MVVDERRVTLDLVCKTPHEASRFFIGSMRQIGLALFSSLFVLSVVACSSSSSDPAPSSPDPTSPVSSSGGIVTTTPTPSATGTTTPTPTTPEWVAPVVATSSAACNGAAMPQAVGTTYTTPSGRTYHVWGPSNYDPTKTYPVVMTFHGWQTDGPSFEAWFQMENYVNNEAFVVYPDAVGGYWDLKGTTDVLFFDEMVKQIGETYCIDPSHILGFGFSYGAYFMNLLGCQRAGYVKALMMGDGGFAGPGAACGRLPVLVTVRTNDTEEVPANGRAAAAQWSTLDQCTDGATEPGDTTLNCVTHTGCKLPGQVTFCEDTYTYPPDTPNYDSSWNHTVREPYRTYAYQWFKALP